MSTLTPASINKLTKYRFLLLIAVSNGVKPNLLGILGLAPALIKSCADSFLFLLIAVCSGVNPSSFVRSGLIFGAVSDN